MPCSCKSGCHTNRCSCRQKGDACSYAACGCLDCRNNKTSPPPPQSSSQAVMVADNNSGGGGGGSASASAVTKAAVQKQTRRVRYIYDERGQVREAIVEQEDERSLSVAATGAVAEPIMQRLLEIPAVLQLTQAPNATLAKALTVSFLEQWKRDFATNSLRHLYTADAVLVLKIGSTIQDYIQGVDDICRIFESLNGMFEVTHANIQDDLLDNEKFVLTVRSGRLDVKPDAVLPPDNSPTSTAVTQALVSAIQVHNARAFEFVRSVQCVTLSSQNELLPIYLDTIHIS